MHRITPPLLEKRKLAISETNYLTLFNPWNTVTHHYRTFLCCIPLGCIYHEHKFMTCQQRSMHRNYQLHTVLSLTCYV